MLKLTVTSRIAITLAVAGTLLVPSALAQANQTSTAAMAHTIPSATISKTSSPYVSRGASQYARKFYQLEWGVDSLAAKAVQSGQLIRFGYRVTNASKAKALNDKKSSPYLIDETAGVKLVVPSMEKVGQLRQSSTPEVGRTYWMLFSNKEGLVKRGSRVSVVIGKFRVDELLVE